MRKGGREGEVRVRAADWECVRCVYTLSRAHVEGGGKQRKRVRIKDAERESESKRNLFCGVIRVVIVCATVPLGIVVEVPSYHITSSSHHHHINITTASHQHPQSTASHHHHRV
jgi:hypothetical protein